MCFNRGAIWRKLSSGNCWVREALEPVIQVCCAHDEHGVGTSSYAAAYAQADVFQLQSLRITFRTQNSRQPRARVERQANHSGGVVAKSNPGVGARASLCDRRYQRVRNQIAEGLLIQKVEFLHVLGVKHFRSGAAVVT